MNGRAYYNDSDPFAAQWLRNLIAGGHVAPGDVDERSIVDVQSEDLRGYTQCHFFAGIGGWSYALRLAGWSDDRPVWTGSCPCQPFSLAGSQAGFSDPRHLWPRWFELIQECRPSIIFGEQVASATDWLRLVRSNLEALDYALGAMPIEAASAGADHLRDRYWFVANTDDARSQGRRLLPECAGERLVGPNGLADSDQLGTGEERQQRGRQLSGAGSDPKACDFRDVADPPSERQHRGESAAGSRRRDSVENGGLEWVIGADGKARRVKSGICLLAHGVSARVGKLRGFGNAIDPRPAAQFILAAEEAIQEQIR